jgi:hypothetical protein
VIDTESAAQDLDRVMGMSGAQFLYTRFALRLSPDAQQQLEEKVDGVGLSRNGKRVRWRNVNSLIRDLENDVHSRSQFGPKTSAELRDCLEPIYRRLRELPGAQGAKPAGGDA